ncbi:MAG: RnfABCDGE type electron transport complex subunit D [Oscillospiraceae bacterium]|nr:RnfABCDGE type electron transport complex subunit D [Oscillospiraceae bacterium]
MRKQNQQLTQSISDRFAALLALTAAAAYDYGIRIIILAVTAAGVSLLAEYLMLRLRKKTFTLLNTDAAVSGLILLMLMPPTVPFSLLIMSCIFAIIIGRGLFGGMENPVIPSAAAGFCFAFLNQHDAVTAFPAEKIRLPLVIPDDFILRDDLSAFWNRAGKIDVSDYDLLTTVPAQPIGSASLILLLVIAVVLMLRHSASPWLIIPASVFSVTFHLAMSNMKTPLIYTAGCLLANQLLFALIFLFGDPRLAPPSIGGITAGLAAGISCAISSRFWFISDAPVFLVIILSPAMLWIRTMMQELQSAGKPKGGIGSDESCKAAPE